MLLEKNNKVILVLVALFSVVFFTNNIEVSAASNNDLEVDHVELKGDQYVYSNDVSVISNVNRMYWSVFIENTWLHGAPATYYFELNSNWVGHLSIVNDRFATNVMYDGYLYYVGDNSPIPIPSSIDFAE